MLHERLADYLAEVEDAVRALADGYVERYEEEILTPERVNLRLRLAIGEVIRGRGTAPPCPYGAADHW